MSADAREADELLRKWGWWTSETVNARLADSFGDDAPAAATLLATLVGEIPGADEDASHRASCRLMLDALKLSAGELGRLALWVEQARRDPRDLIGAAEYRRELSGPDDDARAADLAEYLAWVAGA